MFWSSSSYVVAPGSAWYVNFLNGAAYASGKSNVDYHELYLVAKEIQTGVASQFIGPVQFSTPGPYNTFDVDGNTHVDALTDGLVLLRYMFGLRGPALTAGAIGAGATRDATAIEGYINSVLP